MEHNRTWTGEKAREVDLILFMGQSNMAGRGTWAQAPQVPPGAAYEFRAISDPTRLYPLAEPFGLHENNEASGVSENLKTGSMVSSFVIEYHKITGRPVVGVSCSKGGSSINQWQPNGPFLDDAIERCRSARKWLVGNGYTITNQFMVWCQGETDAENGMAAEEYTEKTKAMIEAMTDSGLQKCYIVRIGNHRDDASLWENLINAQTELCRTYKHAVLVSTKFDSMAADGLMKDVFHYLQQGYNITGEDAGINTAFHVITKKEPYMYDSRSKSLYIPIQQA